MRSSHPTMRAIADQFEKDEVRRWATTLSKAKVSRWGAMISTPDEVLQVKILSINKTCSFCQTL